MQSTGVVKYVETAARHRAEIYRHRAADLHTMAQREPVGSLRKRLVDLAREYEALASGIGRKTNVKS